MQAFFLTASQRAFSHTSTVATESDATRNIRPGLLVAAPSPEEHPGVMSGEWHITDEPYSETDALEEGAANPSGHSPMDGPQRGAGRLRRVRDLGYVLALVTAVGLVVVHDRGSSPGKPVVVHVAAPVPALDPLDQLVVEAHLPGRLTDYVRSAASGHACAFASPGHLPRVTSSAALRRWLPRFSVMDSSQTLDIFAGVCSIQTRARDHAGTIVVLSVTSPTPQTAGSGGSVLNVEAHSTATVASSLVSATTARGWRVRVGTTGPPADQPATRSVLALAQDPTLTW
jgi:hypothetical protein